MIRQILILVALFSACSMFGQTKTGHVNTGVVLESMPASAVADSMLRLYQDSLAFGFQTFEAEFGRLAKEFQDSTAQGLYTPKQGQERQARLAQMQQEGSTFQSEAARMFEVRRGQYLQPLIKIVSDAISQHAKANGFNMIFDSSIPGFMLYTEETSDETDAVIAIINQ